ncbi:hypothetical protein NCWK1_5456 [Nostoc cycadae WK-1]|uniref:Uncharacterized protein n=1 Tax=Nostoc cycadae WK-1 TaxID=1861711 RepID=A0A2H6LR42_9NOSO|nr:hypothetical protein NCWK1_5456 [Nostoc cycadae WK-1]
MKLTREASFLVHSVMVSIILIAILTSAVLAGKHINLEYGQLKLEINNSQQICELTRPKF